MNLPNKLTTSRFFITIAFVIVVLWDRLPYHTSWAALLFFIGGLTDIADGIIARRRNLQTAFGALMDPLADKVLVCAGFILLVGMQIPEAHADMILGVVMLVFAVMQLVGRRLSRVFPNVQSVTLTMPSHRLGGLLAHRGPITPTCKQ